MTQQVKVDETRYTYLLKPGLKRVFRIALARAGQSQRAFFKAAIIALCKEYAPDDYKDLENNHNKA